MGWLLVIAWCTLRSAPASAYRIAETSWHCLVCGEGGATDTLLNLLLFAPLGALAHAAGWRLRRIVVLVCCCSTAIELVQANFLVGRDGTLGDVIANTSSGAIGWFALPLLLALARPTRRFAVRSAWVILITSSVIWFGTGFGLRPALTGPPPWWGQRLHLWSGHDPFPGTLQRTALNGVDVPNDPLDVLPARRDTLALEIDATRTSDHVPVGPVSILRVVDGDHHVQVGVSQNGEALTFEVRVRASGLLLRTPEWRIPDAMRIPPGQPWRFEWHWFGDRIELRAGPAAEAAGPPVAVQPLSVALGWIFVHPFLDTIDHGASWWTALWLAWWFGLLGWCAGAAGRRAATGFGVAGLAALAAAALATGIGLRWTDATVAAVSYLVIAAVSWSASRPGRRAA